MAHQGRPSIATDRRRLQTKAGQAVVLLAIMVTILFGAVGMAVDAGLAYLYGLAAERAAAASAVSAVVFMPGEFNSPPANNAVARALTIAKKNGFDTADVADAVVVDPERVPIPGSVPVAYYDNELQVTVSRSIPTAFMQLFGFRNLTVSRTAIATYQPPISLGQPGGQMGSTTSQLGTGGSNYYFMRTEGWNVDRAQGDPFTPNPASEYGGALSPASTDVHLTSTTGGTEPADPTLPSRGGYNYLITIPASGGRIQVYNAAFAPDGNGGKPHNNCENTGGWTTCSSGGAYYLHEEDGITFSDKTTFTAMRYTLFKVNNAFIRADDVKLTQMTVYPIDATNWNATPPTYKNMNNSLPITQTYDLAGNPTNMSAYHSWMDIATYPILPTDQGEVAYSLGYGPLLGALTGGTYRLRVDSLDYNGSLSGAGSTDLAHKGYAVRVLDSSNALCASACSLAAWNDACLYTPISAGSFKLPVFQLPPTYAGKTVSIDIYDIGDLSIAGNVWLDIIDPSTGAVATSPTGVKIYDLGVQRTNAGTLISGPGNTQATFQATSSGTILYNGHWVRIELPIPSTWNPGSNPANWWWSMQYRATAGPATDTLTVGIGLKGNPAHLIQG